MQKLKDKVILENDWIKLKDKFNNSIVFLDPPYYLNNLALNNWNENDTQKLCEFIKNIDADMIYTDIKNNYADSLNFNNIKLEKTFSARTNKLIDEYMYFNF